jgi:hypothetical protein
MVVLVLMCLDLGLLITDGLKEESIDGIVDIDSVDETEPRAINWFDVSSSYGWYVTKCLPKRQKQKWRRRIYRIT